MSALLVVTCFSLLGWLLTESAALLGRYLHGSGISNSLGSSKATQASTSQRPTVAGTLLTHAGPQQLPLAVEGIPQSPACVLDFNAAQADEFYLLGLELR